MQHYTLASRPETRAGFDSSLRHAWDPGSPYRQQSARHCWLGYSVAWQVQLAGKAVLAEP